MKSDLPVHCLASDIEGDWVIRIKNEKFTPSLDVKEVCGHEIPNKVILVEGDIDYSYDSFQDLKIHLDKFYKVYENGILVGNWTPIYDQSFVIYYKNSVLTAPYKYYNDENEKTVSNCSKSQIGWYIPDYSKPSSDWSCFFAFKQGTNIFTKINQSFLQKPSAVNSNTVSMTKKTDNGAVTFLQMNIQNKLHESLKYEHLENIVTEINNSNLSWKAAIHDEFRGLSFVELRNKLGMRNGKKNSSKNTNTAFLQTSETKKIKLNDKSKIMSEEEASEKELKEFMEKLNKEGNKISKMGENVKKTLNNKIKTNVKSTISNATQKPDGHDQDSSYVTDYSEISKYITSALKDIPEETLPRNWDWRNVGGENFIPSVKRQGSCGSCFVFATVTSLEARLRILTNNKDQTPLSKQFPISCNFYSEGCEGGFPYLVAKFFHEFEIVPEDCFPYEQSNVACGNVCDYKNKYTKQYKVKSYDYIGGYYGATNEILMMKEIRARGPIPGNIRVPYTFNYYASGIYSQNGLKLNADKLSKTTMVDRYLTWEKVEHSITLVGYGEENGTKYWIGMNTWGSDWGEKGFFKLLRGENDCSVESMGDVFQIEILDR